jgi:hypothetical protein
MSASNGQVKKLAFSLFFRRLPLATAPSWRDLAGPSVCPRWSLTTMNHAGTGGWPKSLRMAAFKRRAFAGVFCQPRSLLRLPVWRSWRSPRAAQPLSRTGTVHMCVGAMCPGPQTHGVSGGRQEGDLRCLMFLPAHPRSPIAAQPTHRLGPLHHGCSKHMLG